MRAGVADDVDKALGELLRSAGLNHCRRERNHPANEDHRGPGDSSIRLVDREDAGEHDPTRGKKPGYCRWHRTGREQDDHPGEDDERVLGARPERNRLPTDERRLVDDHHLGVIEVMLERTPRPLEQQGVADGEHGLTWHVLTLPLDRTYDEIAALGDHPRKHGLVDEGGARGYDDLGKTRAAAHQRIGLVIESVLLDEGAGERTKVLGDRPRLPLRQEPLAEEDDDQDRAEEKWNADVGELEEPESPHACIIGVLGDDDVDR